MTKEEINAMMDAHKIEDAVVSGTTEEKRKRKRLARGNHFNGIGTGSYKRIIFASFRIREKSEMDQFYWHNR